jgi:anti-anti-sigma factor
MSHRKRAPLVAGRVRDGVLVLTIRASELFKADVLERLGRELRAAVGTDAAARTVLDFSRVTYLSSAALGTVVNLHAHLEDRGYVLVLACPDGKVNDIVTCTRLNEVIPCRPSVAEAVAEAKRREAPA